MIKNISGMLELNNGVKMPGYGFGCYKAKGKELFDALQVALAAGYRYIDTAAFYENEREVGEALAAAPERRDELFIVSKIWPCAFSEPVKALDASLAALQLNYLDGYLLHWPGLDEGSRYKAYELLLREVEKGKIRVLGVSNFLPAQLQELHGRFGHWTPVNQIEVHPIFQNIALCDFCEARQIQVVSWSPLGRAKALALPEIVEIARICGKTPAQVVLRWQVQKNYVPIPKSVHASRIRENAEVFDFTLTPAQMAVIDGLNLANDAGKIGKDPLKFPEC